MYRDTTLYGLGYHWTGMSSSAFNWLLSAWERGLGHWLSCPEHLSSRTPTFPYSQRPPLTSPDLSLAPSPSYIL